MSPRRLFSSDQIIAALHRAGFVEARKTTGSHQTLKKEKPDGGHYVTVVPMGKPEVPEGTLKSILQLAHISYQEFLELAGVKQKRSKKVKGSPSSKPL